MLTDRIISFLVNRSWQVVKEDELFLHLSPPQDFQLPQEYNLSIPKTDKPSDFKQYYNNLLEIFSDFYNLGKQDLDGLLREDDTILRVRIHDEGTSEGKINFVRFEGFLERLKALITDTASFVIDKNLTSTRTPAEAQRYLNKCHFLQTEKGSYVTKIQLPTKETIKDATLFAPPILADEVNNKLMEVLSYVNTEIFTKEPIQVTDDYLIENVGVLNVKLLTDIENLYEKSDIKNVEFSLHAIEDTKQVVSENVTKESIHRLTLFIENVNNRSLETKKVTVRGKIEKLSSKDPDGSRNTITMQGLTEDLPVVAKASLPSEMYKQAIEAHRIKEYISITGMAKTTKTRIQFLNIENFELG